MTGTEWHFQIQPPGAIGRTLVPDVAFLSYDRLPKAEMEATEIPRIAPDIVVEVRSPEDAQRDIDEKARVYLAPGATVIFLVDPAYKTVTVRDARGDRMLDASDMVRHPAFPGFELPAWTPKPALEWINNRVVQKVTPQRSHALAQRRFAARLGDWADENGAGVVGTEWQFQVQSPENRDGRSSLTSRFSPITACQRPRWRRPKSHASHPMS